MCNILFIEQTFMKHLFGKIIKGSIKKWEQKCQNQTLCMIHQYRPERTNMHWAFLPCIRINFLYKLAHLLLHFTLVSFLDIGRTMKVIILCLLLGTTLGAPGGPTFEEFEESLNEKFLEGLATRSSKSCSKQEAKDDYLHCSSNVQDKCQSDV